VKILAIETSGQHAGVAIVDEYITIGEMTLNAKTGEKSWTHSEILMQGVSELFRLTGVNRSHIGYVAYSAGPGAFTGLRIGAATAIGLARGLGVPSVAVPTLDALAYNIFGGIDTVIPMMDARRGQVYFGIYRSNGQQLTLEGNYDALPVEEVLAKIPQGSSITVLGCGADAYKNEIQTIMPGAKFAPQNNNRQRAASIACRAAQMLSAGHNPATTKTELIYVRAPQAVRDLEAKNQ